MKWKHSPRYWPFVRAINRLPVYSAHIWPMTKLWSFLWFSLRKLLHKLSNGRWFGTPLRSCAVTARKIFMPRAPMFFRSSHDDVKIGRPFSLLLVLFARYPSVSVGFHEKGPVTRTFLFSLMIVRTSSYANWWIVGIWDAIRPMWRHLNELIIFVCSKSYQRIWIFSTGDVSLICFAVMQVISGRYKLFTRDELCSRPKLNHMTMCPLWVFRR